MKSHLKPLVMCLVLVQFWDCFLPGFSAQAQGKPGAATKKLEPWEAWDKYRDQMNQISRQLGVTCTYCHNTRNYRDQSNSRYKTAKKHIEMVDMLNEKYKDTFSQKVDCHLCHKGKAKPDLKESSKL